MPSTPKPQSFENHARFVPYFHGFVLPVFVLNLIWAAYRLFVAPGMSTAVPFLVAAALIALALAARIFALTVQDRVIRLEMRGRLRDVLPAEMHPRIAELTIDQLVALRFASDAELRDLTTRVLDDRITDRKSIKRMVQQWEADHLRA